METLLHRRESLILTAIEVIDELGFQGLSTREIAKRQQISEGALFRHFKTKNELILAVLDHYSQYDLDIAQSAQLKNFGPKEALIFATTSFSVYYENYPAITAVLLYHDLLQFDPELKTKVQTIFHQRHQLVWHLVDQAKAAGMIRPDVDSESLTEIMLGTFRMICLKWRMGGYQFSLRERILATLEMVLQAFSPTS